MKTPHKHAALIHAWADGAEIEKQAHTGEWFIDCCPYWFADANYRIKPEPKPDVVEYRHLVRSGCTLAALPNIKLTFDGATGKLKAAEVL